jgi:TetR/AcrR family transcriptional regulator, transcriptional repressor for nem operon
MSGSVDETAPEVQSKGARTRDRLLDLAQEAIIEKGFQATSIEELVDAAGITKSGFFYHFRDKQDLARQLVERWVAEDNDFWETKERRARELSDDPLHSFLIFIKLFAESMDALPEVHPGCLVASITYQARSFDPEVKRLSAEGLHDWSARFRAWVHEIAERYPPRVPVDLDALGDHLNIIADGGIVSSRIFEDPKLVGRQARMFHDLVKALFVR